MEIIRWFVRWLVLLVDLLFRPGFLQHDEVKQRSIDKEASELILYEFEACPFCVKVRWALRRLGVTIQRRDARKDPSYRDKLLSGGGKVQVPCLYIASEGQERWLYESSKIIEFLEKKFSF